jgi:uncharacterized protein YacL
MWHLLISIKFYVYSVLVAHILALFYLFPIAMFNIVIYSFAVFVCMSLIIAYGHFRMQIEETMKFYDYEHHNPQVITLHK